MKRGLSWELQLGAWHDAYRRDRRAFVVKTNPPVKLLSRVDRSGQFRACFAASGPPDFIGTLAPSGTTVVFDAKETVKERWPLADLPRHQAVDLEACMMNGGVAFVALRIQDVGFVLPWERLGPIYKRWALGDAGRGEASLSLEDVAEFGHRMTPDGWLDAVAATLARRAA